MVTLHAVVSLSSMSSKNNMLLHPEFVESLHNSIHVLPASSWERSPEHLCPSNPSTHQQEPFLQEGGRKLGLQIATKKGLGETKRQHRLQIACLDFIILCNVCKRKERICIS